MPSRRSFLTAAGAALALAAMPRPVAATSAAPALRLPASTHVGSGAFVTAPAQWLRLVERFPQFHPGHCKPCRVASTAAREAELRRVQKAVNSNVAFRPEREDLWQPAALTGDCEDFALRKLQMLTEDFGWPRGALTLATCRAERGQLHAVLLAHMERGAYALDNRRGPVLPWRALPYRWKAREEAGSPFLLWRKIAA